MLKYLRITVTIISLAVCMLLIALWVRSYSTLDGIRGTAGSSRVTFASLNGGFVCMMAWNSPRRISWRMFSRPADSSSLRTSKWKPEVESSNNGMYLGAAYWHLIVPLGITAVAPWIQWKRRFSLRTLLIATTIIAVLLGLIVRST